MSTEGFETLYAALCRQEAKVKAEFYTASWSMEGVPQHPQIALWQRQEDLLVQRNLHPVIT